MGSTTKFWSQFEIDPSGCWLWAGPLRKDGYGTCGAMGAYTPHRLSWILHYGPIPDGLTIDHLCNVRRCVNPEHLEAVPRMVNVRRARDRRSTCGKGHPWDEANTYWKQESFGPKRQCRTCRNVSGRRTYHARKALVAGETE